MRRMDIRSKLILGAVAIPAVLIIAYILSSGSPILSKASGEKQANWDTNKPAKLELPEFVHKTGRVAEAYIFAVQNQDKLMYLACYCGCAGMQHSDKLLSHKSLKECYIKPNGEYEPHASECKLCNDITLEARDMLMKGYSLKEVRKIIDNEYSGRGVGTNTSLPP
ncbi:MAG: PCYCGC motif-containing (lipo)protein [Candidatus Methanoperedens sp.]|nr:PCYCGC motif-containing lipoprotein [Candidatus Methanoperedens sp.]MCZ7396551.1 PCYCGC motif-containing lipoprotein [Candidatus Methanoperedens sp.]